MARPYATVHATQHARGGRPRACVVSCFSTVHARPAPGSVTLSVSGHLSAVVLQCPVVTPRHPITVSLCLRSPRDCGPDRDAARSGASAFTYARNDQITATSAASRWRAIKCPQQTGSRFSVRCHSIPGDQRGPWARQTLRSLRIFALFRVTLRRRLSRPAKAATALIRQPLSGRRSAPF
jgi:hypothetical protein